MVCLWRSSNKPPREAIIRHETIQQIKQNTEIRKQTVKDYPQLSQQQYCSTVRIHKIIRNKQELVGENSGSG